MLPRLAAFLVFTAPVWAQTTCPPTPQYSPCDIVFDVPDTGNVDIRAEFRSPRADTALVRAFEDGPRRWVVRFTPAEAGTYVYRLTSRLPAFNGKEGQFTATASATKKGWLRAANLHHFADVEGNTLTPHLWMGAVIPGFSSMDAAQWKQLAQTRARQHFNHLGVTLVDESSAATFQSPQFFRAAEEKIRAANQAGIVVDLAFFSGNNLVNRLLPTRADREKWFAWALSRLAAFDVTWQGIEIWESTDNGRDLLKEIGEYLTNLDPYKHTRSTRTALSSGPVTDDGWLRYRSYQTGDDAVTSIEQQMFQYPSVNNFATANMDVDTFRHRLWNATVNGQYPAPLIPDEQSAATMKLWYEFMQTTRHWELEPFFDTSSGRGLALEGVEYIVYLDKPGPVTVNYEKHGYDGEWWNPATGQAVKIKDVKGESFTGTPPDLSHDWVLHISREGTKAGMLKSVKFDSRDQPPILQQIEGDPAKIPFEIVEPAADLSLSAPARFTIKLMRQSKALERMLYEWTAEVTAGGRSYRVVGTGPAGTLNIPPDIAPAYPAALHIRVMGMNALGKVYALDRNYTLTK
jgi:hypothetical protein